MRLGPPVTDIHHVLIYFIISLHFHQHLISFKLFQLTMRKKRRAKNTNWNLIQNETEQRRWNKITWIIEMFRNVIPIKLQRQCTILTESNEKRKFTKYYIVFLYRNKEQLKKRTTKVDKIWNCFQDKQIRFIIYEFKSILIMIFYES